MSIIKCSECNKEISDKADKCPHCGNPMQEKQQSYNPQSVVVNQKGEGCFLQTLNIGCIITAILIVIILLSVTGIFTGLLGLFF